MALACMPVNPAYPQEIVLEDGVVNTHGHPRDDDSAGDGRAEMLIPNMAQVFETVIGIGNTKKPLTTPELARAKGDIWRSLVPPDKRMNILVAGLMTEETTPDMIVAGYDKPDPDWHVMKMFLRAVSNSNGSDVNDVLRVIPCIKAMTHTNWQYQRHPMVLMVHAERKYYKNGRRISFFDREYIAVKRDIALILKHVPDAVIVVCHISDRRTLNIIRDYQAKGFKVFGEIAPHYAEYCIDDLFEDGKGGTALNAHRFCLPIFKSDEDRQAILAAMVSGEPFWHCGLDDACHIIDPFRDVGVKISKSGIIVGGQTQIPEASISYVLEQFVQAGTLQHANAFLSGNARRLFNLPPSNAPAKFRRTDWPVPEHITRTNTPHGDLIARVAMGGQIRKYKVVR